MDSVAGGTGGSGTGGGGGSGGSAGTGVPAPTLEFTEPEPLVLMRGDKPRTLEVQAWPPGEYTIRFALLPASESMLPGDASLSATDVPTGVDGRASVELTPPSAPTTFKVRASTIGGASVTRDVMVPRTGKADLRVIADYPDDARPWTLWSAAAVPNETCTTLPGGALDDDLEWTDAPSKEVALRDVPVDVRLAVFIRAEHFAWGCATVPAVVEGLDNHVTVPVTNVPIALSKSEVSVSLDLAMFQTAFRGAVEPSIVAALEQVPGGGDDVSALLDRMQAESDADEASFIDARAMGSWDAAVRALLGDGAATALRAPLERWIRAGLTNTSAGRFVGTLGAEGSDPEGALLTLQTVAGLPPDALGFSAENDATWYSSSPGDDVFFGGSIDVDPSMLLMGGALAPARTEVDGAETIAEALASLLSCEAVASELVSRGAAAGVSYAGCDLACARSACEAALASLVDDLSERDEEESSRLDFAASATNARVGSEAELVGLEGTWVGSLVCEGTATDVGGVVIAPAP